VKIRFNSIIGVAAVLAFVSLAVSLMTPSAVSQDRGVAADPKLTGPAPRLPNGKPDLSGVWERPYVPDMSKDGNGQKGAGELPFTAWGKQQWESYDVAQGDYAGSCMPFGMTRSMAVHPLQIIQNNDNLAFLFEQSSWFHVVQTNGKPLDPEMPPAWFGYSAGHWDGDTLVVETANFNGYTRLDTIGHPHSNQLKLTQTFKRLDYGHIQYTVTVDDPKTYTRPWKNERAFTFRPDWQLMEYSCLENNRDLFDGHIKPWRPPVSN